MYFKSKFLMFQALISILFGAEFEERNLLNSPALSSL
ncbi:hypothetical protein CCO0094, partial [Campylobacter coli RM2228]